MVRVKGTPQPYESMIKKHLKSDLRYFFATYPKVEIGESLPILDLLFTHHRRFLIRNNGQKVTMDDLKGKTIVLYMLSLMQHNCQFLLRETVDLIEAYNEVWPMGGFEVVFVPKRRGDALCAEERFNDLFSRMPWPAVPFSNKEACDRLEQTFCLHEPMYDEPYWAIIDHRGKILFTRVPRYRKFFSIYSGTELFPLTELRLVRLLYYDDDEALNGIINLDGLLGSHTRDFLLTNNDNKVPISSLKDKVVGLYFCDNVPKPPRIEEIKRVYREAKELGYNFEIVQITFHFRNAYDIKLVPCDENVSLEPCFENIPWLKLPFKDSCCRRLRRLFNWHKNLKNWKGDSLVIIDPHKVNSTGAFFECHGANIIQDFGIKAYPFTRRRVYEMMKESQKEVKLYTIFPPGGPPLIRPRSCGGWDRVPISHLWGKRVLVLFGRYFEYGPLDFILELSTKYIEQHQNNEFEVVFVSCDTEPSKFEECIKEMPWLVHPYSWDFAQKWRSRLFKNGVQDSIVAFKANGNLLARHNCLPYDTLEDYPFFIDNLTKDHYVHCRNADYWDFYSYPF